MKRNRIKSFMATLLAVMLILGTLGVQPAEAATQYFDVTGVDRDIEVRPGRTVHVRVSAECAVDNNGSSYFDDFYLVSEDEFIRYTNLKISSFSRIYPGSGAYGDNYYLLSEGCEYTIEFDVTADPVLPTGDYEVELVGAENSFFYFNSEPTLVTLMKFNVHNNTRPADVELFVNQCDYDADHLVPGGAVDLIFYIENISKQDAYNTVMNIDYNRTGIVADYANARISVGTIRAGEVKTVIVPVKVDYNVTPGAATIVANLTSENKAGVKSSAVNQNIDVIVGRNTSKVNYNPITITTSENYRELTPGTTDNINLIISNEYDEKISNLTVYCTEGLGGTITKNFLEDGVDVSSVKAGATKTVKFPVVVLSSFSSEAHQMSFVVEYTDPNGSVCTSKPLTMYVKSSRKTTDNTLRSHLTISNVSQDPAQPVAGAEVSVSFTVTNDGNNDLRDIRFSCDSYSAGGIEPVTSELYQREGNLKVGASKNVTMRFRLGESIGKGLNRLPINFSFIDSSDGQQQGSEIIYILDVKSSADVGRPKLIVSDYSTDSELLKAGDTFEFTFKLKNTHASKEAKNIKVTLTQSEGIFAPVKGTNIFYIDEIPAGEATEQKINLKTRADAATGDYSLVLTVEYEYPNMNSVDAERGGISEENVIKLRATENYRPVIENIFIDSWEGIYVGGTADLSFEFYNMGKSTLGNVYITVEGDFCLANNSKMSYIGAVGGYGQEYVTAQVVPLVSGNPQGILTVHFEDSNGDEQTLSSDFSAWVADGGGMGNYGGWEDIDWGDIPPIDPGYEESEEEKGFFDKIPTWGWIVASAVVAGAVVLLVVLMTRKINARKKAEQETDWEDEDN